MENIDKKIQSLRSLSSIQYTKPENKNKEYGARLLKSQDALIYLVEDRGFKLKTIEHFQLGLTEKNCLAIPIYKNEELIDYKFRTLPPEEKGFFRTPNSETWIFNEDGIKEAIKQENILITEGEIDLMTLWQNGFKNIISLVGGAMSIGNWIKELDKIPKIWICLDSDSVGQKAARNLADRLGIEKCINIKLPVKDINDFFKKYKIEDFKNVLKNSEKFPIEDVIKLKDIIEEIKQNKDNKKDFQFAFPQINSLTGGFNRANLIMVSGPPGHGKGTYMLNMTVRFCLNNCPTLYIPLEDSPKYLARRALNILADMDVSMLPDDEWDTLEKQVLDFPMYIYIGQEKFNLDVFRNIIEIGKKVYGIEIFVLDHLHFLAKRGRDITEEIGFLIRELVTICRIYNIVIFCISHVRRTQKDEKWTKMPDMTLLKDSSGQEQDAHMVLMLLQKEYKNDIMLDLEVQKNREGPKTRNKNYLHYIFDVKSGIIKEYEMEYK